MWNEIVRRGVAPLEMLLNEMKIVPGKKVVLTIKKYRSQVLAPLMGRHRQWKRIFIFLFCMGPGIFTTRL